MKKRILFKYFIMNFLFLIFIMAGSKTTFAKTNTNTTLEKATPISIGVCVK